MRYRANGFRLGLSTCDRAAMTEENQSPAREPSGGQGRIEQEADVRVTMEVTRQALEASAAEIERSKRLLRQTDEVIDALVASPVVKAVEESGTG